MIQKILIAIDGSSHAKKAVELACDIASKMNATIYLIHVVPFVHLAAQIGWPCAQEETHAFIDSLRTEGEGIIARIEKDIEANGIETVYGFVLEGDPAKEVLGFAKKNGVDMIIMGSHGAGSAGALLIGSVSHKVTHLAPCTCVTVK
jgi:nucleotide-binding universal stress UspA family protein